MAWRPLVFRKTRKQPCFDWVVVRQIQSPCVVIYWTGKARNTAKTIDNVWTIDERKARRFQTEASARWSAENTWATAGLPLTYKQVSLR